MIEKFPDRAESFYYLALANGKVAKLRGGKEKVKLSRSIEVNGKKAVNWALRQIGKRNRRLRKAAVKSARETGRMDDKTARWIARDALKELESDKVKRRLAK